MPAQQLGLPPLDGRGQASELGHLCLGDVLEEEHESSAGVHRVGGVVDLAKQLLSRYAAETSPSRSPRSSQARTRPKPPSPRRS